MNDKCEQCNHEFERDELRPYGPNRTLICYDCGQLPQFKRIVKSNFEAILNSLPPGDILLTNEGPVGLNRTRH